MTTNKASNQTRTTQKEVPKWELKAIYRLAQKIDKPGIYPFTLIVTKDGRRQLVIEGGKVEDLGR